MRLFAAIDPPRVELDRLAAALPEPRPDGLRWVSRDQWHVTLAFFGEVPDKAMPDLVARLSRAAMRTEPMSLSLHGAGTFPRRSARARVLWVGVAGDTDRLARLADRCAAAGRRCGLAMEDRPFRAHLTLARAKRESTDMTSIVEPLTAFQGEAWRVAAFRLVQSTLGPAATHRTLHEWAVAGA